MITLSIYDLHGSEPSRNICLQPELMPDRECSIGRLGTLDVVLDRPDISRLHAKLSFQNGRYYFTDLDSSGGSRLHNELVQPQQAYLLCEGDVIQLGRYQLTAIDLTTPEELTQVRAAIPLSPDRYMPVAAIPPSEIQRWQKGELTVRCLAIVDETADVKTFRFAAEPPVLFTYKPGQFVTLELEIEGEQVIRSYTISSTPSRPHSLEITVKRVPAERADLPPGLVSNWLHENLRVGDWVKLQSPLGKFSCFDRPDPRLLFISAGSGITPMMSMSRWIGDTMADCDIVFLHSARHVDDIIYRQELELMSARHPNFRPIVTLTRPKSGSGWLGLTGRIDANLIRANVPDFRDRTVFVCGPNAFMSATKQLLASLDYPMEKYNEESFGAPKHKPQKDAKSAFVMVAVPTPSNLSIAPEPKGKNGGLKNLLRKNVATPKPAREHSVEKSASSSPVETLDRSTPGANALQMLVRFQTADCEVACDGEESILDIAEQAKVKIRSSCRSGVCGTCKQKKVEGEVRMDKFDPEALEPDEQAAGYILTCVAFPQGRVVIDV